MGALRNSTKSLLVAVLLVGSCSGASGNVVETVPGLPSTTAMSPAAASYIEEALGVVRDNYINTDLVDWGNIEQEVVDAAWGAQNPADTYEAIRLGLRLIPAGVGHFSSPLEAVSGPGHGFADFDEPVVELRSDGPGYVRVGKFIGDIGEEADIYAAGLAADILALNEQACGWIVDLRVATFGIQWPMLGGLAPLLSQGELGGYTYADGSVDVLASEGGSVTLNGVPMVHNSLEDLSQSALPVAVLVGSLTGLPGEAVAIAFLGQHDARIFGQPTRGHTAAIQTIELSDEAVIALTTARFTDRAGNQYGELVPVEPDQPTPNPTATEQAGIDWLLDQPACQ